MGADGTEGLSQNRPFAPDFKGASRKSTCSLWKYMVILEYLISSDLDSRFIFQTDYEYRKEEECDFLCLVKCSRRP